MNRISSNYEENVQWFNDVLGAGRSCDMVCRDLYVGGRRARFWVIDGFGGDAILERMGAFWLSLPPQAVADITEMQQFVDGCVTFMEADVSFDRDDIVTSVLLGKSLLLMEGVSGAAMMDAKNYPGRGVEEPADGRVLRGAHEGFVEALVPNLALLRRRIRDPHLTMEPHRAGGRSKTDIVLCYLNDRADPKLLEQIRQKLEGIDLHALSMGQESLAEAIRPKQWYNPFPKVRYTERPDCASANVAEGKILLIVDNSPAVMILPTSIFDFIQDTNDFYFPPLVGTYLRFVRGIVFFLTLFLTPIWYLLMQNPDMIPPWLEFVRIKEPNTVPIIIQLLVIEIMIDGVKLASLNTPGALNNAFGMVGALLLGEFAITAGLFVPEVMLYMAFVAVANFTQPSFELGYAFKLFRMLFLILTALFNLWGFAAGVVLLFVILLTTRTISGRSYFFPVIPFNGRALWGLIVRRPITRHNAGEKRR